jgi:1A family penicillin-binding protein
MKKFFPFYLIKEVILGILYAFLVILTGGLVAGFLIYKYQTPEAEELLQHKMAETSIIYDRSGSHILYEIHGEENRKILAHKEIPNIVRQATIAAEDKAFYSHHGVSISAIARALKTNVENNDILEGGSTITQQLARNVFLGREKTFSRKTLEAMIAIKIERRFSKDDILDLYLNEVPYGSNAYGIQAAAQIYFGKNAADLTIDEAALIAALPKATTYYSPYSSHQNELESKRKSIIRQMVRLKYISEKDAKDALAANTLAKISPFRQPITAPHFVFYVVEELEQQYGRDFLETGGLKVMTTLDWDFQRQAEQEVAEGVKRNLPRGATTGAMVVIDPKSGDILAMVGSKDYFDRSIDGEVNVAVAPRQPGSSFKPIVYAAAFEKGYQPESEIVDEETNFGRDGTGKDYIPKNYDGEFHGEMKMRDSLAMSLNIPAIKTLAAVGIEPAKNMARRLGITTFSDNRPYGLSMAIGGAEVKLLDLTAAFSVFANDGKKNPSRAVIVIYDDRANKLYNSEPKEEKVIDVQVARKINSILSDNNARTPIFGPNSSLNFGAGRVAAKTGTTQDFKDAWTVGYTPSIAVGVWIGNNDGRPMRAGSDGVFVAAPVWRKFMDSALPRYSRELFTAYVPAEKIADLDKKDKDKSDKKKKKKHG